MIIELKSIDEEKNRYRYYMINDLQLDLFSTYSLEIHYGRMNTKGRSMTLTFNSRIDLESELKRRIRKRIRNDYVIL